MVHLDDNNRYILPETNVAENGIFICNVSDEDAVLGDSLTWKPVDNLNTWLPGEKIWKFGFDSKENLPYIQFPEDISQLIEDGLRIKYIRTNGLMGNISKKTLCKLEVPSLWSTAEGSISELTKEDFIITNNSAATNGTNPESLTDAYNNFKKTVGTFDTLVTCRDYMNKIYQLTISDTNVTPLVSNCVVSDIRDDINKAVTLCSFNEYGICYLDKSLTTNNTTAIEHFDLILYPFKTIYGLNDKNEYISSFKYNAENYNRINYDLKNNKTLAHNLKLPAPSDIACIKNYVKLNAEITTVKKVTLADELDILSNIYKAIYENFNLRKLDFGERIPVDTIKDVIKNADQRIKDVSSPTTVLYTKFMTADNSEYDLVATEDDGTKADFTAADTLYNKLVLRNILAGKIAAFQYDDDFVTDYTEQEYTIDVNGSDISRLPLNNTYVAKITSKFEPAAAVYADGYTLGPNEVIQFRMPNLKTVKTFPCYVNYYLHLDSSKTQEKSLPASFQQLSTFLEANDGYHWENLAETASSIVRADETIIDVNAVNIFYDRSYGAIFKKDPLTGKFIYKSRAALNERNGFDPTESVDNVYWTLVLDNDTFGVFYRYLQNLEIDASHNIYARLNGLYRSLGADMQKSSGKLVDANGIKYLPAYTHSNLNKPLNNYYVQQTHPATDTEFTVDGLGKDATFVGIAKDSEYQLSSTEYILFNWTDSQKDESGNETKTVMNKVYGPGTIIKPNFDLTDSELYKNNHSFSKKSGFSFSGYNIEGMFTLDANEQIGIRDVVQVDLDKKGTYLYWIRNDEDPDALKHKFTFDEYYGLGIPTTDLTNYPSGYKPNAYILKEGEQLYYTDDKKTDLVFYGTGTLIVKHKDTPELEKNIVDGTISAEDIITYGLDAIPFGNAYDLSITTTSTSGNRDCSLTIIENQYINLTEGDTLYAVNNAENNSNAEANTTIGLSLSNNWQDVSFARYKFAEGEPQFLPTVVISGLGWKVRSRLDINLTPSAAQILKGFSDGTGYHGDSLEVQLKDVFGITGNEPEPIVLRQFGEDPMAVYSNYACQLASDHIELSSNIDLKIKLAKVDPVSLVTDNETTTNQLLIGNYVSGNTAYTKFSCENIALSNEKYLSHYGIPYTQEECTAYNTENNLEEGDEGYRTTEDYKAIKSVADDTVAAFTLNINIGGHNKCGIILFYYIDELAGTTGHFNARLKTNNAGSIKKFNTTGAGATEYILQPGLQIMELSNTTTELSLYTDYQDFVGGVLDIGKARQSNIIFSKLDIIRDINPKLNYRYDITNTTAYEQLLSDIRLLGNDITDNFYYNVQVDNNNAIDINLSVDEDTLAEPDSWYDPNNVNNKFVVTEIDADYLAKGITLTNASRLKR